MQQNPQIIARDIASVIALPKGVTEALAAYNVALGAGTGAKVDVALECMTIAPDKVDDLIASLARDQAEQAALPAARGEVADLLSRRVARELGAGGSEIIDGLAPIFTEAAETYTTAVRELPADTRPEALVSAGSGVLALYETATGAVATLDTLRKIRDQLAELGVRAAGNQRIEQWTRVLDLENADAIDQAIFASKSGPLGRWHGWLSAAGVRRLWWPSLAEQTEAIARIEATLPKRREKKDPTIVTRRTGPVVAA